MWLDRFRSRQDSTHVVELQTSYQPRAKRFQLNALISFDEDGLKYDGYCVNVSATGVLATFAPPGVPELWTEGRLSLEAGEHYLSIGARVARLEANNVAFAFCIDTDNDRATIGILLDSVSDHPVTDDDAYT